MLGIALYSSLLLETRFRAFRVVWAKTLCSFKTDYGLHADSGNLGVFLRRSAIGKTVLCVQ